DGDRRAAGKRCREQLGWRRALVPATGRLGFVRDHAVLPHLDLVLVSLSAPGDRVLHELPSLPSNSCGFGSSAKRASAKASSAPATNRSCWSERIVACRSAWFSALQRARAAPSAELASSIEP